MPARKLPDDEFMAAAIGDLNWLKQCMKDNKREKMEGVHFDKNGLSALHLAAIHGRLDCIVYMLESQRIDINIPSSNGWRAVHLCISNQTGKRAFQCLTHLLKKGADPSVTNDDGITPVHQAASEGHFDCLKLLLEIGATLNTRDCRGNLPIDLAKLWGHRKCARMLANHTWHHDKEDVAQEMRQLKKQRMREVLDDLDRAEEIAEQQQFFGQEAFKDWLSKHKAEKHCEHRETTKRKAALSAAKTRIRGKGDSKPSADKSTAVPNIKKSEAPVASSAPRPAPILPPHPPTAPFSSEDKSGGLKDTKEPNTEVSDRPPRLVVEASRDHILPEKRDVGLEFTEEDLAYWSAVPPAQEQTEESPPSGGKSRHLPGVTPIDWSPMHHPSDWNPSTHVTECFQRYQAGLRDLYPRDEFTLEPHWTATPVELNPSTQDPIGLLVGERDSQLVQAAGLLRLDEEEKEEEHTKTPRKKQYGPFRGMVYKCQTILDVPGKTKARDVTPAIAEAALHLTSDVNSLLFQSALIPSAGAGRGGPTAVAAPSSRQSKSANARGARMGQGLIIVDDEMRARFCQLGKPSPFPAIN